MLHTALPPAALYKGCYAYREDFAYLSTEDGSPSGEWPQLQYSVEIPLIADTTGLLVSRANAPPTLHIAHNSPTEVHVPRVDWAWLRLSTMCDPLLLDVPIPGCSPGMHLGAAIELDTAFSRTALRYHSMDVLLAHAPVHQPITLTPNVAAAAGIIPAPPSGGAAGAARESRDV